MAAKMSALLKNVIKNIKGSFFRSFYWFYFVCANPKLFNIRKVGKENVPNLEWFCF